MFGLASANGLSVSFGWISLLAGVAILALSLDPDWLQHFDWARERRRQITITLAALSSLACLLVIVGVSQSSYGAALQAAWGCYLTLAASIAAGVCAPPAPLALPPSRQNAEPSSERSSSTR